LQRHRIAWTLVATEAEFGQAGGDRTRRHDHALMTGFAQSCDFAA